MVTNIAHIPAALTAVMRENAYAARLRPRGQPGAEALVRLQSGAASCRASWTCRWWRRSPPYNEQIAALNKQIGAVLPRQTHEGCLGRVADGREDPGHSLHGVSMLDAAQYPLEANVGLALLHEPGGENDCKLVSVAIGAELNLHGDPALAAAQAAREAGNAPNSVLAAAASIVGPRRAERARDGRAALIELLRRGGCRARSTRAFDVGAVAADAGTRAASRPATRRCPARRPCSPA